MRTTSRFEIFFRSYLRTAAWATTDEDLENFEVFDWSDAAIDELRKDAIDFFLPHHSLFVGLDALAGQCFWLTRCGHAAGFWDEWPPQTARMLNDNARAYGDVYLWLNESLEICVG